MFFALLPAAFAAPCPLPAPDRAAALTPDGAAHLLAHDATLTCWWIVDDAGDARVGARWDRARRDPTALAALADGRVVLVLHEYGERERWRVAVRAEGAPEQRLPVDLPSAPREVIADPEGPVVALVWTDGADDVVWRIDLTTGRLLTRGGRDAPR